MKLPQTTHRRRSTLMLALILLGSLSVDANLWRKIKSQVAVSRKRVFDEEGHFLREAELDLRRKTACFAEVDEVFEGKCQ